jgi:hypothetical protein
MKETRNPLEYLLGKSHWNRSYEGGLWEVAKNDETDINGQIYWGFGLCSLSGILETRKHNVSETESFSLLR